MANTEPLENGCPNCGYPAGGQFCSRCGQEQGELLPNLSAVVREVVSETLEVDGKLPRTLKALVWPPGGLTLSWVAGRRSRFVSPFRLYLVAALVFFFAWPRTLLRGLLEAFTRGFVEGEGSTAAAEVDESVAVGAETVVDALPGMTIVFLVPVFAILLHLTNRRRMPLVGDVVAAIHVHVIVFLVAVLTVPFQTLGGAWESVGGVLFLATAGGYTWAEVARVYALGALHSLVRTTLVLGLYLLASAFLIGIGLAVVLA